MELSTLTAISPLDGRYFHKAIPLRPIFSEFGLFQFRVMIELRWLEALADSPEIPDGPRLSASGKKILRQISEQFSEQDAQRIKEIELSTQHDMKAVEYFIQEKLLRHPELKKLKDFIHFGCTSDDVNNIAYAISLKMTREQVLLPLMDELITLLTKLAHSSADVAMLSRTHGQPATTTTLGKEIAIFSARLKQQRDQFEQVIIQGKWNGAVGNFNAHTIAYPDVKWPKFSKQFVESFGIDYNAYTTQIEPHDWIAEYCHTLSRFNTILIDFCRDVWGYISLGYFKLKVKPNEVGSSTMPHKVNPIDFENAEGNLGISNALLWHLSSHLPLSRWQRDLTDSTRLRNLGLTIGHTLIGYQTCLQGINKITVDSNTIAADLSEHWEILAEAIQTVMRRYKLEEGYEQLKTLTRGHKLSKKALHDFIEKLTLPDQIKKQLLLLTPASYLGHAVKLAKDI